MSAWQSSIDTILANARTRAAGQDPSHSKQASAASTDGGRQEADLLKEAREAADALDFMAGLSPSGEGSLAGFLAKKEAMNTSGKSPGDGPTKTTGEQKEPKKQTGTSASTASSGSRPATTEAPTGKMPDIPLRQDPGSNPDHSKSAAGEGATLYDLVMQGRGAEAVEAVKEAKSPQQGGALEGGKNHPSANEGTLVSYLRNNAAPVSMSKRQAKAPTRARLMEVFKNVNDSSNADAAKAAFPNAVAKGQLKIAMQRIAARGSVRRG